MKRRNYETYLMVLLLFLLSWNASSEKATYCGRNKPHVSEIISSLCSRITQEIGGYGNYFFSPLSISAALAMLYIGSKGTTQNQMANALGYKIFGENCLDLKVNEQFRSLLDSLESKDATSMLLVANSAFIHADFPVSAEYISRLKAFYKSDVGYLDFTRDDTVSMRRINEYVSNRTNGHIKKLLNEPLDPMTIMILMNVIYFKGLWKHPFREDDTWDSFFYRKNNSPKLVPFMILQARLNYHRDEKSNYTFLELDYAGESFSMLLVLPKSVREFPAIQITNEGLCDIRNQMTLTDVMVALPKFQLEYRRELSRDMMNMGMNEIFSDKADFSNIREERDIHVSLIMHKALIEVNEQGTQASAVSGVGIDAKRKQPDQVVFWADHPFLFYIIDKSTNVILFTGRVSDP